MLFFVFLNLSSGIFHTQSVEELYLLKQKNLKIKIEHKICLKQLQNKKIPISCYNLPQAQKNKDIQNYLDEKCQDLKFQNIPLEEITSALKNPSLSPLCREVLQKKASILRYKARDFLPESLKFL